MNFYIIKEASQKIITDFVYCEVEDMTHNLHVITILDVFQDEIMDTIMNELREKYPIYEYTTLPGFFDTDYTFIMKCDKLILYKDGSKLCTVRKSTVKNWLSVFQNWELLKIHYLYSSELLNFQDKKESQLYKMFEKRFNNGDGLTKEDYRVPEHYGLFLSDYHETDVWHRPDKPAYVKHLDLPNNLSVKFIVSKEFNKWNVCIQLPYVRKTILGGFTSERKAMNALRKWILKNQEHLKEFAVTTKNYEKIMAELQAGSSFIKSYSDYLKYLGLNDPSKDWWLINSNELESSLKKSYNDARNKN